MPRKTKLPQPQVGEFPPQDRADWHQRLHDDMQAALNIQADAGSGIVVYETATGVLLMLDQTALRLSSQFETPVGGIAARSGTTPGSALCTMKMFNGTVFVDGPIQRVYNWTTATIAASTWIQANKQYGYWFIGAENCPP
jgi:hypothetical protein